MKQLKKYAIGFNTVTSTDGVISTRGVKSKPNNIEVYGYTHEVGEGEKSPDNTYQLISLDSGAMTVDNVVYEHSIKINNNDRMIQVPTPFALNSVDGISDYIYKDSDGAWKLIQMCKKYKFTGTEEDLKRYNESDVKFPVFYITEGQGLKIKNNSFIICNYYVENSPGVVKSERENFSIWNYIGEYPTLNRLYMIDTRYRTVENFKNFLAEQYENGNPLTVIYQLETPITHVLSDYAQDLLNSFTLQNQNEISVEGHPNIEISGYIQK